MTTEARLDVLLARQEIGEALAAYCRAVDRIDVELGRSVFHPDAVADYGVMFQGTGHGFMDFVRDAHLSMLTHSHHIGGITIRVDGDRAGSECYVIARLRSAGPDGALHDTVTHGRYVDLWERRDGTWRIAHRRYLHTMDETRPVARAAFPTAGRRDLTDPSYEVLRDPRAALPR